MSRYRDSGALDCKLYVGDLGSSASKQDLEDAFSYYGPLRNVWVARNPPGFAFVEFEDPRDAEDAARGLDGRSICGRRVRVEMSNGKGKGRNRGPPPRRGRPFHPDDQCYECGERGHYARDCHRYSRRGGSGRKRRSRSRDRRSRSRSHSASRSRSRGRGGRSRSRSAHDRGSRENTPRDASRSRSRDRVKDSREHSASRSRSRSRPRGSAERNGKDYGD